MGRPPQFSRSQIQRAALEIVDRDGLDQLTMRNVAAQLRTGPMTLYGHVRDRADLEVLVVDAIFESWEPPAPAETWNGALEDICTETWAIIRRHPNATNLILARRGESPAALAVGEAIAAKLREGGLTGQALIVAFRTLLAAVVGGVEADPMDASAEGKPEGITSTLRELIEQTPGDFPSLTHMLPIAAETTAEEIFRGTVHLVIAGIEHVRQQ